MSRLDMSDYAWTTDSNDAWDAIISCFFMNMKSEPPAGCAISTYFALKHNFTTFTIIFIIKRTVPKK